MNIHLYCRNFMPSTGGMERLFHTLANEFHRRGHSVEVVTETSGEAEVVYPVKRGLSNRPYFREVKSSDVILSAPLSLRRLWLQLASGRPVCVAHPLVPFVIFKGIPFALWRHLVIPHVLKRLASHLVINIVPSQHMAKYFPRAIVIPNPYDDSVFVDDGMSPRSNDLLFVGRLIIEKGCHVAIRAFAQIAGERADTDFVIVGDGPQRAELEALTRSQGIGDRVRFVGNLTAEHVAQTMRRSSTLVVPSLWDEPFGIVALEGLACGCEVVVARVGGLPEAVGDVGHCFERGDIDGLAAYLRRTLAPQGDPKSRHVQAHLEQFKPAAVAERYLAVLEQGESRRRRRRASIRRGVAEGD